MKTTEIHALIQVLEVPLDTFSEYRGGMNINYYDGSVGACYDIYKEETMKKKEAARMSLIENNVEGYFYIKHSSYGEAFVVRKGVIKRVDTPFSIEWKKHTKMIEELLKTKDYCKETFIEMIKNRKIKSKEAFEKSK